MPSATFTVETSIHGRVAKVTPIGWLTEDSRGEMGEQFRILIDKGFRRFVVDMASLHVLDGDSLSVIVSCGRNLAAQGGCLILVSPDSASKRILFTHNLARFFRICDAVGEALALAASETASGRWKPVEV
jgi:anti-anti-sigma factor